MKTALYFLIPLTISVTILLRAEFKSITKQIYFFKPLSTCIIIITAVAALGYQGINMTYYYGIIIGLLFSLAGDIMLMFNDNPRAFKIGLVAFLIGHIAYTATFIILTNSLYNHISTPLIILFFAIAIYTFLKPGLGNMKIPVILYIVIISAMVSVSTSTFNSNIFSDIQSQIIFFGACLFFLSDVVLAINKFRFPFELNRLSLIPYFLGQFLLALSVWYF